MNAANWTAIIVACLALIGTISTGYMMFKAKKSEKKKSNNPGGNPGGGNFFCYAHGERLLKIELENERISRELVGIKGEITSLRNKLNA